MKIEEISERDWGKNWAGNYSLLSNYFLGFQYTKQLKEALGEGLGDALFITTRGVTSCYFLEDNKKKFAENLIRQLNGNPDKLLEWSRDFKKATDETLALIKELKKRETITQANFETFIVKMSEYGIYHRIVKVIVDYLPPEILEKYIKALEEARIYAEPVYSEMEKYMQFVSQKIAREAKSQPELVLSMTNSQFADYFRNKRLPEKSKLERQYENSILYMTNGMPYYFFEKKTLTLVENAMLKQGQGGVIKGQSAYPGKAKGKARIILEPTKNTDFETGNILVTGMTRPEYMSLIKKSAGFVTDAGGVLSHAAITAREMKKPCIIGTKIATKVLKDGDLVEVDADRGIVRILEQ